MRKLVAVVLVIVAMALAACTSSPKVSPASTTTTVPTRPLPAIDLSATPTGWVPVAYGDAQVSVPPEFLVYYQDACENFQTPGTVYVDPLYEQNCASQPPVRSPQITGVFIRPVHIVPGSFTSEHSIVLNGLRMYALHLKGFVGYYVPVFGIQVTADGPMARSVVNTLTRSPRAVALASGATPPVPSSWRTVTFTGLAFSVPLGHSRTFPRPRASVPADWIINSTQETPGLGAMCRELGVAFSSVTVTLSTDAHPYPVLYCPEIPQTAEQPKDGVQVDAGLRTEPQVTLSFSTHCLNLGGLTACPAISPAYSILVLKVTVAGRSRPVYVSIGLAGNGMVARTILYSLRAA